ncbi:PEBP-like protein [Jackrogersella minutella]|nr:PEBP-like protein [Jackrogersella minutella]
MKGSSIISVLALAGVSAAQTPEGFTPVVEQKLEVTFGTKSVTPGLAFAKTETSAQPKIGLNGTVSGSYVWMLIDLDASTNFVNPSQGQPTTYLHTVIRDFKASGSASADGVTTLTSTVNTPVAWFAPAPPPESPPHPHRYTNLLWEQPENWQIPAAAAQMLQSQKTGFNVPNFITAAGLEVPIAANYFNVTG